MCEVQCEEQRWSEKYDEETIRRRWHLKWHLYVYIIIWIRFSSTIILTFRWLISQNKNFPNLRNNVICKQKRTQNHRTHSSDPKHLSRLQGRLPETKIIGKKTTLRKFQSSTTCLFFFLFRLSLCPRLMERSSPLETSRRLKVRTIGCLETSECEHPMT